MISRVAAIAAIVAGSSVSALAEDIKPLGDALFDNMAVAYYCRSVIGAAHYQAAISIATNTLAPLIGEREAADFVGKMDKKFKDDPRANGKNATAEKCFEIKANAMRRIEIERTKLSP